MTIKFLIVDDNKAVRQALHNWLVLSFPDCSIIEAATGEEAVQLASEFLPQVVIMDIELPEMNGIVATERITSRWPAIPVIILTMHQDEIYRLHAQAAGATAYVTKYEISTDLLPALDLALSSNGQSYGD